MEDYIKIGKIAVEAKEYSLSLVKEDKSLLDAANKIEEFIIKKGAIPCKSC